MKYLLSLGLLVIILSTGCEKRCEITPHSNDDYFEFGYFGGFTGIQKFYVIKNSRLYPGDSTKPALGSASYAKARVLTDDFPLYLWAHPNQSFGCPGCADQIFTRLRYRLNGVEYIWTLDNASDQLPAELRDYVAEVNRVTDEL